MNQKIRDILHKYSNPKTDTSEELELIDQLLVADENDQLLEIVEEEWNATPTAGHNADLDRILNSIHHNINIAENSRKRRPLRIALNFYRNYAATILLPFLIAFTSYLVWDNTSETKCDNTTHIELTAPASGNLSFSLPDGTEGVLNTGSTLKYSLPFGDERYVALKGEGFFHVKRNTKVPFIVDMGKVDIKVLGTEFNAIADTAKNCYEVVLVSGKVLCNAAGMSVELKPNERLTIANNKYRCEYIDADKYVSWKDGKIIFQGEYMSSVVRRLKRYYNVDIEVIDIEVNDYKIWATFEHEKIEDVISLLKLISPIEYTFVEPKQEDNGSFNKKKIELRKTKS